MKSGCVIFKCIKCGKVVKLLKDCENESCTITCCNSPMIEQKPNSVDAAKEKHVPTYEIKDGKIIAKVNHVMEEEHYIEWISLVGRGIEYIKYFMPGDDAVAEFDIVEDGTLYAYCNKHGLWSKEIYT